MKVKRVYQELVYMGWIIIIAIAFIYAVEYLQMALYKAPLTGHTPTRKSTSQGSGGRGRRIKISTSSMNKNKKRSYKKYRGQGR